MPATARSTPTDEPNGPSCAFSRPPAGLNRISRVVASARLAPTVLRATTRPSACTAARTGAYTWVPVVSFWMQTPPTPKVASSAPVAVSCTRAGSYTGGNTPARPTRPASTIRPSGRSSRSVAPS